MKKPWSIIACCIISLILLQYRLSYSGLNQNKTLRITTWDAFGYYVYLPSTIIYHDATELKWLPEIDKKYHVSGGSLYQANKYKNGKYVFKYLGGVAILEIPLFLVGHGIAKLFHFDADGFSAPYQYSLAFGVLLYCILSVFLLRKILLKFFSDLTTAATLLLVMLATNIIQYVAIDNAQSHGLIFPLYVLILYFTIKWHEKPKILYACLIGYVIGLASISRPTEAIMMFIPIFWGTQTKESAKEKWNLVKLNKKHLLYAIFFTFLGVLPQLIYWQIAAGFFVYDVGSKWTFLNPFFRVLFGFENGWFIYTPVTVFFILGMFYMKPYPFKKSVLWFCLLNIYIIISWFDWKYGATYSTRALSQSYPLFALPLGAFIERVNLRKWKILFYVLGLYLIGVNLFQIVQYNKSILHYYDMNRKYYARIYLNPDPTPLDMSVIDTNEIPGNENKFKQKLIARLDTVHQIPYFKNANNLIFETTVKPDSVGAGTSEEWLKIEADIKAVTGFSYSYLSSCLQTDDSPITKRARLFSAISKEGEVNRYAYFIRMPKPDRVCKLRIFISSPADFIGSVQNVKITEFTR